jgi:Spy/CpxP family protein refolding chaperone
MSYGVQGASLFGSTSQTGSTSSTSLRPFANLNLTEDQRKQIRSIFQTAKSQGLSQTQVQQEINAILTPAQQTTLQSDIAAQTGNAGNPEQSSGSATSDPPSNIGLTDDQKSKIDTVLQQAQANGTSQSDVLAQINAVLTPTQQSAFLQDVQIAAATTLILQQFQSEVGASI